MRGRFSNLPRTHLCLHLYFATGAGSDIYPNNSSNAARNRVMFSLRLE